MTRVTFVAAFAAAMTVPLSTPALAGPGDDARKEERERRRQEAVAAAERAARKKQADDWTARLHSGLPLDRLVAAWNLQALLPDSQEALLGVLREARRYAQRDDLIEAVSVLGEARLGAALPELRSVIEDAEVDDTARLAALMAVAKLMDGEAQVLLEGVASGDAHPSPLRQAAILALGMIEAPIAGRAAEALTRHEDPMLRMAGYRAIGWSRDRRYISRCAEGLDDPVPLTASMAAKALGRLNDPATTDRLVEVSRKTKWGELRFFILEALGRHKHQPALDELLRLVQDPRFEAQTDAATFLYEVGERRALPIFRTLLDETVAGRPNQLGMDTITAYALGAMNDKEAAPALLKALRKGRVDVRREAATALGAIADPSAVAELSAIAGGAPDRQLRVRALLALGKLRAFDLTRPIQQALADRDPTIRWAAVVALESRGDAAAVTALRPLLRDAHPFVTAAATSAIALLEGTPSVEKDPRAEAILVRLRALEREMLLRGRQAAQRARNRDDWSQVIGWESYVSTCGGTHPPIEVRAPNLEGPSRAAQDAEESRRRDQLEESYDLRQLRGDGQRVREQTHERARAASGGADGR